MTTIHDVCQFLERFAPAALAADWDNVGLLVGDRARPVTRIMTCLTLTPITAAEAIHAEAELVVAHHPLPFRPLKRLLAEDSAGRLLLNLIEARVAVHSPHTGFDSAVEGINAQWAAALGLRDPAPLAPAADESIGGGRHGLLAEPQTLAELAAVVRRMLGLTGLHTVGPADRLVRHVAVACGAAAEFLQPARALGCECLITGEARFHACLEAEALEIGLILPGHYASERFGVEFLARRLGEMFPSLAVWASRDERDPLVWR